MDSALRWAQAQSSLVLENPDKGDKKTAFKVNRLEESSTQGGKWSPGTTRRSDSDYGTKKSNANHQKYTDEAVANLGQGLAELLKNTLENIKSPQGKPQWQRNKKNGWGKKKDDDNRSPSSASGHQDYNRSPSSAGGQRPSQADSAHSKPSVTQAANRTTAEDCSPPKE